MKTKYKLFGFLLIIFLFLFIMLIGLPFEIIFLLIIAILVGLYFIFGKKKVGANMGRGSGVLTTLAGDAKWFAILVIFIFTLIVAGILSLTWGALGLIGLFLLFASFYVLFMQRANVAITIRNPFTILFAVAIVCLVLSFSGIDSAWIVDLSSIPGMNAINQMFSNTGGCASC